MSVGFTEDRSVAKKKADPIKKAATMVRVYPLFAEKLNRAASFKKMSIADFAEAYLSHAVDKVYHDAILKEAKDIQGK